MRSTRRSSGFIGAATAAALLLLPQSTFAQVHDGVTAAPMDCSQTSSMMDQAKKAAPPEMTGVIDHDTMAAMRMHMSMMMQMAKIEASCGKDPKMQAAAKKLLSDSTDLVSEIQRLTSPY